MSRAYNCILWVYTLGVYSGCILWVYTLGVYSGCILWVYTLSVLRSFICNRVSLSIIENKRFIQINREHFLYKLILYTLVKGAFPNVDI